MAGWPPTLGSCRQMMVYQNVLFTTIISESDLAFSTNAGGANLHGFSDLGFLCSLGRGLQTEIESYGMIKIRLYLVVDINQVLGLLKQQGFQLNTHLCLGSSWLLGCLFCLLGLFCSSATVKPEVFQSSKNHKQPSVYMQGQYALLYFASFWIYLS